jgi:hypothetical protein
MESHCGIQWAFFAGHWWQSEHPVPEPKKTSHEYTGLTVGSMTLVSVDTAKFSTPGLTSIVFHPASVQPPPCS